VRVVESRLRANFSAMLPSIPRRNDGSNLQDWNPPHVNLRHNRHCDALRHLLTAPVLDRGHGLPSRRDAMTARNQLPFGAEARLGMARLGSLYVCEP